MHEELGLTDRDILKIANVICGRVRRGAYSGMLKERSRSEIYADAMMGIAKALKEYSADKATSGPFPFLYQRGLQRTIDAYRTQFGRNKNIIRFKILVADSISNRSEDDDDYPLVTEDRTPEADFQETIDSLPINEKERKLLTLHFVEGYTRTEAAEILGIKKGFHAFSKILQKLRKG